MNDQVVNAVLSSNLRALLQIRGFSINALARKTGDSVTTVHAAVCGKHIPRFGLVVRMAEALGVSVSELADPACEKNLRETA